MIEITIRSSISEKPDERRITLFDLMVLLSPCSDERLILLKSEAHSGALGKAETRNYSNMNERWTLTLVPI